MVNMTVKQKLSNFFYPYEFVGVLLSLLASYVGGIFSRVGIQSGYYDSLIKSSINPPDITFPIVWTILYVFMGIGIGRIWRYHDSFLHTPLETGLFILQLGMNVFWTFLFFYAEQPVLGFFEIIPFLLLLIFICGLFFKTDKIAGFCYVPYVLWVSLAGYLNYFIVMNN